MSQHTHIDAELQLDAPPRGREDIVAALVDLKEELRRAGVVEASLFGSVARGTEAAGQSDLDIAVRFESGRKFDAIDVLRVKHMLTDRFGVAVDLVELPVRDAGLARAIEKDAIRAF